MESLEEYNVIYAPYVIKPFHQKDVQVDFWSPYLKITFTIDLPWVNLVKNMPIQESGYKVKSIIFLLRLKQENQEQSR